jgi:ABC-2 type transport system ATP-binding protein
MVEVHHLTKRFGATVAVDDVSFQVAKGEVLGFLGPNGAGKTTTMRILTCFMPSDEGTATLAGYDIWEHPVEVRRRAGYLPEDTPLYPDMGVVESLEFVATVRQIPRSRRAGRIREMIDTCGLGRVLKKDVGELSKGFRQRLGLAQTLIHDPEILMLDEPTTGLDPLQILEIRNLIKQIGKEKTVILSTHILPEVAATCGRVLIINEGLIVADGQPDELAEQAAGGEAVFTTIRGPRGAIEEKLRRLPGLKRSRLLAEDREGLRWELIFTAGEARTEEIFNAAAQSGWTMTELRKQRASLEDVFLQLTTREKEDA